jgi:predicted ABC-type ATPase
MKLFIIISTAIVLTIATGVALNKVKPKIKLTEHEILEDDLIERYKILQDSVADLEKKASILNNYLNMKHIEYMEVCDLVYTKKKK